MNGLFRRNWWLTVAALLLFASTTFAIGVGQQVSITFGSGSGVPLGGVYVDPYTATVDGVSMTVLCDDFKDEVWSGEKWDATVNNVYELTTLPVAPLFGKDLGSDQQTLYSEAAWLSSQALANPSSEGDISFALWELTYCSSTALYIGNGCTGDPYSSLPGGKSGADATTADAWVSQAAAAVKGGYTGSDWQILTPDPGTQPSGYVQPQEFLVHVPEPSTRVLLGADVLGLLGLVFAFRRRVASAN